MAVGGRDVSPAGYYGAAMSILFLFFTTGFAARSILAEKRDGTLARLLSGPTPPAAVIGGKTASVSVLGLAGFVTVWGVTTLLFGAYWGPPAAVLALMAATVVAVAGVATLVASLARTRQQAESYTAMVTFALALIGGNFLGPGQLPEVLSRLALLTPNGWALTGLHRLGRRRRLDGCPGVEHHRAPRVRGRLRDDRADSRAPADGPVSWLRIIGAFVSVLVHSLTRDRTALFFMIALPVIVIVVVGAAFGGSTRVELGVVALDTDPRAAAWSIASTTPMGSSSPASTTSTPAAVAIRQAEVSAVVVIPEGFEASLADNGEVVMPFAARSGDQGALTARVAVTGVLEDLGARVGAARLVTAETGGAFDDNLSAAVDAGAAGATEVVTLGGGEARDLSRFSLVAPQNLVLFVFITSLSGGAYLVTVRNAGVLRRVASTRASTTSVLAGLTAGWFAVAVVQSVLILGIGALVFGVRWGDPTGVILLTAAFAAVGASAGLLLGALGRDDDKVGSLAPIIGITLGALGGCMVPIEIFPPAMETIAHGVPQFWAMTAWQRLVFDGAGVEAIVGPLLVLTGFASALLLAATLTIRRQLHRG